MAKKQAKKAEPWTPLHERIAPVEKAWPEWVPTATGRFIGGGGREGDVHVLERIEDHEFIWVNSVKREIDGSPLGVPVLCMEPSAAAHWFRAMVVGLAERGYTFVVVGPDDKYAVAHPNGSIDPARHWRRDPLDALIDAALWLAKKEGRA